MSERTRVTCETCGSFLHETRDCKDERLLDNWKQNNMEEGK